MDKTFLFTLIGFFVICACFISWASIGGPKRNFWCKVMAYGYAILTWIFIIALIVLTILY